MIQKVHQHLERFLKFYYEHSKSHKAKGYEAKAGKLNGSKGGRSSKKRQF
jgi:hypothetical protein